MRVYSITMSNLAFDTHKFVKDLTRNGMPDKQAEVLADHYASLLNDRLATKEDMAVLDHRLMHEIEELRKELKGDIEALRKDMNSGHNKLDNNIESLRTELKGDMNNLEERVMNKLTIRILSVQLVGIVTICTIISFMLNL